MSNIDYITLSSTYDTLINACFGINAKVHCNLGIKNDILLIANGMDNLRRLLQKRWMIKDYFVYAYIQEIPI